MSLLRTIASLPRSLAAWLSRWWILLLFVVMPPLEMFLLLQIGSLLGPLQTFLLILITGVVGGWLAKREGLQVLRQLSAELQRGLPPGSRLVEGALVLAGGILLITPGVLTDLAGMLLIFPHTRRWLAPHVLGWLLTRFSVSMSSAICGVVIGAAPSGRVKSSALAGEMTISMGTQKWTRGFMIRFGSRLSRIAESAATSTGDL